MFDKGLPERGDKPWHADSAFGGRQHLGARSHHGIGPARPPCGGVRPGPALPRRAFPGSCASFIAARRSGPIRRAISPSSWIALRAGSSMCCCRSMSRGFCSPRRARRSLATSRSRCRASTAIVRAHNKLGFSQILSELDLPQPATRVVASAKELMEAKRFPMVLKTPVGTASRGTWIVKDDAQLDESARRNRGGRLASPNR